MTEPTDDADGRRRDRDSVVADTVAEVRSLVAGLYEKVAQLDELGAKLERELGL